MAQNRIREIRKARGLTLQDVADRIAAETGEETTRTQISRLELGTRKLTETWLHRLGLALQCDPTDLIHTAAIAAQRDEVEVFVPPGMTDQQQAAFLAMQTSAAQQMVTVTGTSMTKIGIVPGTVLSFRMGGEPERGAIVLAKINGVLVLREFVPPDTLLTQREGVPVAISLDDRSAAVEILGVHVLERQ